MIKPFNKIALAFSGGGFRASGFTLGTLSYLEKIGLLNEVEAISSVSGGSLTAVKYAQGLIDNQDFDAFFENYYSFLNKDTLADDAIADLNKKSVWSLPKNSHKSRNTINAFAIQYNKLTKDRTFGDFHKYSKKKNSHLKKLIINATDFSEAIHFRIKNIGRGEKFGNNKIKPIYRENWRKVKLGDALASSSAFPGGFEPILFPDDFYGKIQDLEPISLMDGGIVDNQGASSLLPSSISGTSKYGFYFISDVASPYVDEPQKAVKAKTISKIIKYAASFITLLICILITLIFYALKIDFGFYTFLYLSIFLVTIQGLLIFASRKINAITGIKNSFRLPTEDLGKYITNRIYSLVFMMSIVMLKNNRRNNANNLYERFSKQSITSTIYELRCEKSQFENHPIAHPENAKSWDKIKLHTKEISTEVIAVAKKASAFGTTLWFKDNAVLDNLVACGEFTACYNLIAFMVENQGIYPITNKRKDLFDKLITDWNKFQENPKFLLNSRKLKFKLKPAK